MLTMTPPATTSRLPANLDELLPDARYSERHRLVVDAPIDRVWRECLDVRPSDIAVLGPLLALRKLPAHLRRRGNEPVGRDGRSLLDVFEREGFVSLRRDERPHDGTASVVMGAAGRFWSPSSNQPIPFPDADAFVSFDEPGNAKTAFSLVATARDGRTEAVTRTVVDGTDARARRRFGAYWALIRLPSGLIRRSWLAAIRRRATA